jgi:hypothetical protein
MRRKSYILVCIVSLFISPFVLNASGQEQPYVEECNSLFTVADANSSSLQPYIGSYMATDYIWRNPTEGPHASAVRLTVSFRGTDKSVIQNDNFLCAGIAAQGQDTVHGGCNAIDWGYIFCLGIGPQLTAPIVYGEVVEGHEWVYCLPGYAESIYSWMGSVPDLTINSWVTLVMEWALNTLEYYVIVDGTTWHMLSYTPPATADHYFMTGTTDRMWGIIPLGGTVKFLQFFGAWSRYNIGIGRTGWYSHIRDPGYIQLGRTSWTVIPFAYSTDGRYSHFDHVLRWGGDSYWGVNAGYSRSYVNFYPAYDGSTLLDDTLLWDPYQEPGQGCPYICPWDGGQYAAENNLLPASEMSNGEDVGDYYRIEQSLVPRYFSNEFSLYSLQIAEFENEHSYFDQIKLIAVDHAHNLDVAVTSAGKILTYQNPHVAMSAFDNYGNDWTNTLSTANGEYYVSSAGDFIILDFGDINVLDNAKLVLRSDFTKTSIHVQVLDETGEWTDIGVILGRINWAIDIVDLSLYLPDAFGQMKVRLYFTDHHKIDYVGLDVSPQADIQVQQGLLVLAFHSSKGSVLKSVVQVDGEYAELEPNQHITLAYLLRRTNDERTFIIYVRGHYYTISA